jgi:hypothetical protein
LSPESVIASRSTLSPRPGIPPNAPLPAKIFGIIYRVVRLRNSVETTAVKSPEQMRDVAQIGCDQTPEIKVDDPEGTLDVFGDRNFGSFRRPLRSGIISIFDCQAAA